MNAPQNGRYDVRVAENSVDIRAAQALRARCFGLNRPLDEDAFDPRCTHITLSDRQSGAILCTFRMLELNGADICSSYAAQHYDVSPLGDFDGRMLELGRFCIDPDVADFDLLRLAWAAITAWVDDNDVKLLFGCSSFAGTETSRYLDAFAVLGARHSAPERWSPRVKAPEVFRFAEGLPEPDPKAAVAQMPPLLRTYLKMGGWVSDHAVVDRQMKTLHVFTGVEVDAIPAPRKRLLRAISLGF